MTEYQKKMRLLIKLDRARAAVIRAAKRYAKNESEADYDDARLCDAVARLLAAEKRLTLFVKTESPLP